MCGDNRPAGARTSLGALPPWSFPSWSPAVPRGSLLPQGPRLQLRLQSAPSAPHTMQFRAALLEYYDVLWGGNGQAELSTVWWSPPGCTGPNQGPGGSQGSRRAPVAQPDLPQKASGVPIGTTVSQHGHRYSMRTRMRWYPLHPTPFPLPPRHPALRSRNIPYPRRWGGRGQMLEILPFSRAEPGKVLAEERPILPSQNWGARVAPAGLLRSEHTSSPGTRQLPGRAWSLPGWSHPSRTLGHV